MDVHGSKPKVLVTVLVQGWVRPELAIMCGKMKSDERADVTVMFVERRPSEDARNGSVQAMLENGFDYLISIDHDIIPLKSPIDLVMRGLDVVGAACPQVNMSCPDFPIYFVGMDKVEDGYKEHKQKDGLQEVDAVGSGCLCMSRKVLEAVKAPFMRKWDENGMSVCGLDFYFCEKAKELGFKVYTDYELTCDHIKEVGLLSMLHFKQAP